MENSSIVKNAIDYIRGEACKNGISIEEVAKNAGFSTDYFNRIFAAHTGFNVMEYVRFMRLRRGAILLRQSESSVLDIALECGYEAHESFIRAFKKQYGMTPSEYRDSMKTKELLWGDVHNETVGARLTHEFPMFKIAHSDEVIDYLLERDSLRFGYRAVNFAINGGAALYEGESITDGVMIVSEWVEGFGCEIISRDYDLIAKWMKLLRDERILFCYHHRGRR